MAATWDNISDAIMHYGKTYPDRPAIVDGPSTLTYGQFAEYVRKASVYLRDLGISADHRVGIALVNSTDHLILYFGLMRIGATVVEIPSISPPRNVAALVKKLGIYAMFIEADAEAATASLGVRVDVNWRRLVDGKTGDARTDRDADHCRLVTLTSGSTGLSRGVVSTHRQRMARVDAYQEIYKDRWSPENPAAFLLTRIWILGCD